MDFLLEIYPYFCYFSWYLSVFEKFQLKCFYSQPLNIFCAVPFLYFEHLDFDMKFHKNLIFIIYDFPYLLNRNWISSLQWEMYFRCCSKKWIVEKKFFFARFFFAILFWPSIKHQWQTFFFYIYVGSTFISIVE